MAAANTLPSSTSIVHALGEFGPGNDNIKGDGTDEVYYGNGGNDSIYGGGGLDTLYGNDGDDFIQGGLQRDQIFGGAGNDIIDAGVGRDKIDGGEGIDTFIYKGDKNNVTLDINKSTQVFLRTGSVKGIEVLDVTTGAGFDNITTHKFHIGDDKINVGSGNDFITVYMLGKDVVSGGSGSDKLTLVASSTTDGVSFALTTSNGKAGFGGVARQGTNTLDVSGVNKLVFVGYDANDTVTGGAENDWLDGNNGDDILQGGKGADRLRGGDGNDLLTGGAGNDNLEGGAGDDVFIFAYAKKGRSGVDSIKDFENGTDQIRITGAENYTAAIKSKTSVGGGDDTKITLKNGSSFIVKDVDVSLINGADFLFIA